MLYKPVAIFIGIGAGGFVKGCAQFVDPTVSGILSDLTLLVFGDVETYLVFEAELPDLVGFLVSHALR